jgi:two-component system nitrate/nitrite response regulator NarL
MGGDSLDGPVTVAVIDDHPVVIEGIQAWLAADPRVAVIAAGDSLDVLTAQVRAAADVLLLDLNLHGRLVLDTVADLADAGHRIIVYSQFAEHDLVLATLDAGAREFIAKHEGRQHLVEAVLAVTADRPYVTPTTAGAIAGDRRPHHPVLSQQERTALLLWFQSMSKSSVASRMNVSPHTVDMYIRRARLKYAQAGRSAPTKADLLARAIEDGLVRADQITPYRSTAEG